MKTIPAFPSVSFQQTAKCHLMFACFSLARWRRLFPLYLALVFSFAFGCAICPGAERASWPNGLHFRPAKGAFADAIPFFWQGTYHVFYLRAGLGGTTWEHLSSTDLLHWSEHPTALRPGTPGEPDGDSVFTGSIIEHAGVFHAFYTGWNPRHATHREQIMHATSPDLDAWTKLPELTFHADGAIYQDDRGKDFRDPFVFWNEPSREFWMLLFARRASDGVGVVGVWTSPDLLSWQAIGCDPAVPRANPPADSLGD